MSYGASNPPSGGALSGARSPYLYPSARGTTGGRVSEGLTRLAPLIGRVLLSLIFLLSGVMKIVNWEGTAQQMTNEGMVLIPLLQVLAILVELAAGLAILFGCWARLGALALLVYLIPVSLIFHDFWAYEGLQQQNQMIHFLKNLAIMGGLLMIVGLGAGPYSFDARQARRGE